MRDYDDLNHVPRRAVGMAKDLRRMGLRVVTRAGTAIEGVEDMSENDVKQVTDVAREVAEIGKRARRTADDLRRSIRDIDEALGVADNLSRALSSAGAELRGVLGVQTNDPPTDDGEKDTK